MIRIQQVGLRPDHSKEQLVKKIAHILGTETSKIGDVRIVRRSVDAHKRPLIRYVYTVDVTAADERKILKRCSGNKDVFRAEPKPFSFMTGQEAEALKNAAEKRRPPVIVGTGPAGLFCSLMLVRAGIGCVILERGQMVEERMKTVQRFWEEGCLDPESNVQFGEGGAGTFSDGKLNTSIKDPDGKIRFILETFVLHGAPGEIVYDHHPHIGTDHLTGVVASLRREIGSLGGEFRFGTCLEKIRPLPEGGYDLTVSDRKTGKEAVLKTDCVILATGHSARDTFAMLHELGLSMVPKAFACGVRVQHPQRMINEAQYGKDCEYDLGAAPYKLTYQTKEGRGVYSFCMCPGGDVVNASSVPGRLCVNGMSGYERSGPCANSAIVAAVTPGDYNARDALDGVRFQEELERKAFMAAQGKIPVQRFEDFCLDRPTVSYENSVHSFKGECAPANVRSILPEPLASSIEEGMHYFGKKIPGFDGKDVLLAGVESRTSSPVRILRDESGQSPGFPGIFPCGEGAGYAGGITSAAADGIRTARAVLTFLLNNEIID